MVAWPVTVQNTKNIEAAEEEEGEAETVGVAAGIGGWEGRAKAADVVFDLAVAAEDGFRRGGRHGW